MEPCASRQAITAAAPTGAEERLCALYSRARFQLTLVEMGLLVVSLAGLSLSGGAGRLDHVLDRITTPGVSHAAVYVFVMLLLVRVALLPLHWLMCYRLERRFKLLHQGLGSWLWDWTVASALFATLGTGFLTPVLLTLRWWPGLLIPWIALYITLRAFYYRWLFLPIVSLFYPIRFLRAESFYLPGIGRRIMPVYEVEVSAKTRRMNACVLLNGRSGSVLVTDTLIDHFSNAEERVAIAHEFGHLYDHLFLEAQTSAGLAQARRKLVWTAGGLLVTATAALALMEALAPLLGLHGVADPAAVPMEAALMLCFAQLVAPLANAEARTDEREADDFALRITRDADSYLSVMRKLRRANLEESAPCFLDRFLFGDHPTYLERLQMGREYRERFAAQKPGRGGRRR